MTEEDNVYEQPQQNQTHPHPLHLRSGGIIVKTKIGKMISCPDPMKRPANLRTTWHSGEETAIVEWNGLVQAERYRRARADASIT